MTKQSKPGPKPSQSILEVTPQHIEARAYEIYQSRREGTGDAMSDWLQAEQELHAIAMRFTPEAEGTAGAGRLLPRGSA